MTNLTVGQEPAPDTEPLSSHYYAYSRPEVLELVPTNATRILDVGCGAGVLGASIKLRQAAEVHGVELQPDAANKAKGSCDRVWNCTIEAALPELADNYYDCIIAADVLEHVIDPWTTLIDLKEKLSRDGRLVVSLPNAQNWGFVSNLLEGKWDYRGEGILDRTHLRFFTRKSVEELFWNAGLCITHMGCTIRGPSLPKKLTDILRRSGLTADPLEQDARTFQFLVVAEKPIQTRSPRVVVVVLNWNGREDTLECLASVSQINYPNYEVVIVDNGSTDDSVGAIAKRFPDMKILQTGINLGYAGGNNVGMRWALDHNADYIFVLNNDTIVDKDVLSNLVVSGQLDRRIGLLGPTNYYYSKPRTIWATGAMLRNPFGEGGYEILGDGDSDSSWKIAMQVDAIVGSAMLIRRDVVNTIGFFDERFFLCWEEFDFSARARKSGFKCLFIPAARIWHKVGSAFGGNVSPLRTYYNVRNELLWAKKHLPQSARVHLQKRKIRSLRRALLPPLGLLTADIPLVKKILLIFSKGVKTVKRNAGYPINKATLLGLRDYYLGRFGKCPEQVNGLAKTVR